MYKDANFKVQIRFPLSFWNHKNYARIVIHSRKPYTLEIGLFILSFGREKVQNNRYYEKSWDGKSQENKYRTVWRLLSMIKN